MPTDVNEIVGNIQLALDRLPSVLLAVALLGGPTAAYVLYRLLETRRAGLYEEEPPPEYWACAECGSLSRVGLDRCYRCGAVASADLGEPAAEGGRVSTEVHEPRRKRTLRRRPLAPQTTVATLQAVAFRADVGVPVMARGSGSDDPVGVPVMAELAAAAAARDHQGGPAPIVYRARAITVQAPRSATTRRG